MSESPITSHAADTSAIARLARFVLAHRRLVVLVWVLLLPAGIYGAAHISKRLSTDFSLPGQPGYETAQKITHFTATAGTPLQRSS
jgi:RND superfamily putative drug exporter